MKSKICTTIEQSQKLIELGIDRNTADMYYPNRIGLDNYPLPIEWKIGLPLLSQEIPCWSLAALLNVLPNEIITDNRFECHYQINIRKYDGYDNTTLYQIAYGNDRGLSGSWHDMINSGEKENLIDCCVQMILTLHELNLL